MSGFLRHGQGRPLYWTLLLCASLVILSGTGLANEEKKGARIIVVIQGDYTKSNDILFDYGNAMDLDGINSLAVGHPNGAVPFSDLIGKLPDPLPGWTADDPTGMQMATPTGSYSFAQRDYYKEGADDQVSIVIYDTVQNQFGPWYALWYSAYSWESTEGYGRFTKVKGYPAWEVREYSDNSGYLAIGVGTGTQVSEPGWLYLLALVPVALLATRRARRSIPARS